MPTTALECIVAIEKVCLPPSGKKQRGLWPPARVCMEDSPCEYCYITPVDPCRVVNAEPHRAPYPPLLSPIYYDPYSAELPTSPCDPFTYSTTSLAVASAPGAFYPPSIPSPIYPEDEDIKPKIEIMQHENIPFICPHSTYALSTPAPAEKTHCQWHGCTIELDDISHSGIRRHFRDFHGQARGSMVRCKWGGACRSEEMLYDNIAKHIAECHLKSMRTTCKSCGNSFARNDTLKRHLNAGCPAAGRQG